MCQLHGGQCVVKCECDSHIIIDVETLCNIDEHAFSEIPVEILHGSHYNRVARFFKETERFSRDDLNKNIATNLYKTDRELYKKLVKGYSKLA